MKKSRFREVTGAGARGHHLRQAQSPPKRFMQQGDSHYNSLESAILKSGSIGSNRERRLGMSSG